LCEAPNTTELSLYWPQIAQIDLNPPFAGAVPNGWVERKPDVVRMWHLCPVCAQARTRFAGMVLQVT
jgi:hypothetical protein